MKICTAVLSILVVCSSLTVWAFDRQPQVNQDSFQLQESRGQLIRRAEHLVRVLDSKLYDLRPNQIRNVSRILNRLEDVLHHRPPRSGEPTYTSACHVDNDIMFDWNQEILGQLKGTIKQMVNECDEMAAAMYGSQGTSGIKDIQIVNVGRSSKSAMCHIDNDVVFDFDQYVVGRIHGNDLTDIKNQCDFIAKSIYGQQGTSGIKDFRN